MLTMLIIISIAQRSQIAPKDKHKKWRIYRGVPTYTQMRSKIFQNKKNTWSFY